MSERASTILGRLPAHLDAARPDKQLFAVVRALALNLDTLAADLAGARRARRLGHAETPTDLNRLGALHGIGNADIGVLLSRWSRIRALLAEDGPDALEQALATWGIDWPALVAAGSPPEEIDATTRLAVFGAPDSPPVDPAVNGARARLQVGYALRHAHQMDLLRTRIGRIATLHARGNASVETLLEGAANALDLELDRAANEELRGELAAAGEDAGIRDLNDGLFHDTEGFFHASLATDRVQLARRFDAAPPVDEDVVTPIAKRADLVRFEWTEQSLSLRGFTLKFGLFPETVLEFAQTRLLAPLPDATLNTVIDLATIAELAALFDFEVHQRLPRAREVIGLEENPQRRDTREPVARKHAQSFEVPRRGFGRALVEITVTGIEDQTVQPMIVNRDEGHGVGFAGLVPDGQSLVFREDGRAYLDGAEVTSFSYAWQGGCFADEADLSAEQDFLFDGPDVDPDRVACFATATPANALDEHAIFPHSGLPIPIPGVSVGLTRMAYFVQQAHFSAAYPVSVGSPPEGPSSPPDGPGSPPDGPGSPPDGPDALVVNRVPPRPAVGFFDASVFAAPPEPSPDAGAVGLSWLEHEAYALRVLIPERFKSLDVADEPAMMQRVAAALERFRPAGVEVRVEYLDNTWSVGSGYLPGAIESRSPLAILRGGTELPPPPEE